jgi:hypothetical protein
MRANGFPAPGGGRNHLGAGGAFFSGEIDLKWAWFDYDKTNSKLNKKLNFWELPPMFFLLQADDV